MNDQMSVTRKSKQKFNISVLNFLHQQSESVDVERRGLVLAATQALRLLYAIDFPGEPIDVTHDNLITVYSWFMNAQAACIENLHPRLIRGIYQYLESEVPDSPLSRLQQLMTAMENLEAVLVDNHTRGDVAESGNLLTIFNSYQAEKYSKTADNFMELELYDSAIRQYESAIDLNPNNVNFHCNKVAACIAMHNLEQALVDCREALRVNPNCTKAYNHMGTIYFKQNLFQKARDAYKEALILEPNNAIYQQKLKATELKLCPKMEVPLHPVNIDVKQMVNNPAFVKMVLNTSGHLEFQDQIVEIMRQTTLGQHVNYSTLFQIIGYAIRGLQNIDPGLITGTSSQVAKIKATSPQAIEEQPSTSETRTRPTPSNEDKRGFLPSSDEGDVV